jgi:hypothetical protein
LTIAKSVDEEMGGGGSRGVRQGCRWRTKAATDREIPCVICVGVAPKFRLSSGTTRSLQYVSTCLSQLKLALVLPRLLALWFCTLLMVDCGGEKMVKFFA